MDDPEGGQVLAARGRLDAEGRRQQRDQHDESEPRDRGAKTRAVGRGEEVLALGHEQYQNHRRDQG